MFRLSFDTLHDAVNDSAVNQHECDAGEFVEGGFFHDIHPINVVSSSNIAQAITISKLTSKSRMCQLPYFRLGLKKTVEPW